MLCVSFFINIWKKQKLEGHKIRVLITGLGSQRTKTDYKGVQGELKLSTIMMGWLCSYTFISFKTYVFPVALYSIQQFIKPRLTQAEQSHNQGIYVDHHHLVQLFIILWYWLQPSKQQYCCPCQKISNSPEVATLAGQTRSCNGSKPQISIVQHSKHLILVNLLHVNSTAIF